MSGPFPLPEPLPRLVVGDGLCLRCWDADHVEEVTALVQRSQLVLAEFLPWAVENVTVEDERRIQAAGEQLWRSGQQVAWNVVEDGVIRGSLGMHRRGGPHELEIGYWLDVEAMGRGLMTRAAAMATDVAFGVAQIEVVEIVHDAANLRSAAVPARLGYSRVAAYTSTAKAPRESGIKVRWCATRGDWLSRGAPSEVVSIE